MRSVVASLVVLCEFSKAARLVVGAFALLAIPSEVYALSFVQQPQGGTRYPGDGFLLSCVVTGGPPPTYQWYQDGNLRTGATNSQLFLTNLALTNAGNYAVVASSGAASITSAPAALVILSDTDITGTVQDVRHVVIFMQENRSFDEYFGALKGVRGFGDRNALQLQNGNSVFFQPDGPYYVLPFHFSEQCLHDVEHGWEDGHDQWHRGKWDRWIPTKGPRAMPYFTRNDLAYYYALAEAYTICDAQFCSVMGPTYPNRLYQMTGMIDPNSTGGGPLLDNDVPTEGFTWTTYPERLQAAGVSWKVYQQSADYYDLNPLGWFVQYRNAAPGNPLRVRGLTLVTNLVAAFHADVTNGTLPRVSWIIPPWSRSEHPPYSPANGEILTRQLLDALASNPTVYNSTVFVLTYDEAGGYFDHVPPPVPPHNTPDEYANDDPIGLGVRIPTILVSPWSRGGYVCSQVFDLTATIRLLENWTGVHEPNISAWRRQVCGDLMSAFNFSNPDTNYPSLPTTAAIDCTNEVDPTPPPFPQAVPVQETGTLSARPLPYQPNASSTTDCSANRFSIIMTNTGTESVHFAIYPNAYLNVDPRQYDVGPNSTASTNYYVGSSGGRYDLTCYGPNGFQRRFAGNIHSNCNQVEVTATIDLIAGGIALALQNLTATTVVFTVTNHYPTGGPWTYNVPPASTVTDTFPVVANNDGWYDLTARASHDSLFLRRCAGHIEIPDTDFSLGATPNSRIMAAGSNTTFTVTVGAINGFTGDVALSVTGLPTDVTADFDPTSVTDSGTSTLSLTISTNTPPGSYPLTVTGNSSNDTHASIVTLTVIVPDFSFMVAPNARTVVVGSNAAFTITVGATNGFAGDVALSITGLPADVSVNFSPALVATSGTSTLALTISTNAATGSYPLTVTGSSSTTHTAVVTLTIESAIPEWWAQQYFSCTNCPQADPTADPDGDGMNNLIEFLTRTNPTNSASAFRIIAVTLENSNVLVTWQAGGDRTNAVQAASDPSSGYVDVSSNIVLSGSGDLITNFLDAGATTNIIRLYRTRLVP